MGKRPIGKVISKQVEVDHALTGTYRIADGLSLKVKSKSGAIYGDYIYRKTVNGKAYEVAIGPRNKVKLAQAKILANKAGIAILEGNCPKAAIGRVKAEPKNKDYTFGAVLERAFETRKRSLKGDGEAGRWLSPLTTHILPHWRNTHVSKIDADEICRVLKPIWQSKHPTATKALNRLIMVLEQALMEGMQIDAGLKKRAMYLLGAVHHTERPTPHTKVENIPPFYVGICGLQQSPATLALRLLLLTSHRQSPVRHALISQFDLENRIWTVPAEAVKGLKGKTKDIRCPLSPEAVRVVELAKGFATDDRLFPAQHGKGVVSDVGMAGVFKRLGVEGTMHGLRSSFGTWTDMEDMNHNLAEHCLQHTVGSKVARAYRPEDLLEKRRDMMDRWAEYVTSDL